MKKKNLLITAITILTSNSAMSYSGKNPPSIDNLVLDKETKLIESLNQNIIKNEKDVFENKDGNDGKIRCAYGKKSINTRLFKKV